MVDLRAAAEHWLREVLGKDAAFRDGQWEAIEALVVKRQRALVVQRTGWGKSLVYFLATRLLREQGAGMTILISPLLSLMRNQVQAAAQWGVYAESINSSNTDDWPRIEADLLAGKISLLLISPERLANDRFQRDVWPQLSKNIDMVVIDEAHCISDWGHDFRPNYRRIMRLLDELPANTPVLGTTATANNRVVRDVSEILGAELNILRGPLTRDSLMLYVYPEPLDSAERLTLLTHLLKNIDGSGIIYCTTTRDCSIVAEWLQLQGFNVKPYYADVEWETEESRAELERQLLHNEVKALVASVALGMGFDKPDLHFVIHYQQPGNIVAYYQQIGRAGRNIDQAYIILMQGPGDEDIQRYFIDTAFPKPQQVEETVSVLARDGPLSRSDLDKSVNARRSTLEKILTHLEVEKIVERRDSDYHLVNRKASPDYARWSLVTQQRYDELEQMKDYVQHSGCLMRYIAAALDDPTTIQPCGRCKNCRGSHSKYQPDLQAIEAARKFLREGRPVTLEPRKRWVAGLPGIKRTNTLLVNQEGVALCLYHESGWGEMVKQGRQTNRYSDELVEASADLLRGHLRNLDASPTWVTSVPSLRRPNLVPNFAKRLAQALDLPYHEALHHHKQHPEQKTMLNSFNQAQNVMGAFAVDGTLSADPVLLVDDIADSKWTLTVLGDLLQQHGSGAVYPFVLASMSVG